MKLVDLASVDQVATTAARQMNRRKFLRRAGAGALGFSMATALLGASRPKIARARGTQSSPCGPSPICPANWCDPVNCLGAAQCARRTYNSFTCTSSYSNSWVEDYRSTGGCYWHCSDCCCQYHTTGTICTNCTGRRACICRYLIAC